MTNPLPDEAQADATEVDQFPVRLKQAVGDKSIRGFARECGFSDTVLRQYLNGQSEPTRPAEARQPLDLDDAVGKVCRP
ncbi:MAG: hypothetical protein WA939_24880, partial [Nodosilinea sp.]